MTAHHPTAVVGSLITPFGERASARIEFDTHITAVTPLEPTEAERRDHSRLTWVPGFVDLHNHGGNLGAFPTGTDKECVAAAEFHHRAGTTTLLASLVSATRDEACRQSAVLARLVRRGLIAGIHMEGPFVSPAKCGAQDPACVIPGDPEYLRAVIDAADGALAAITLAPETANFEELTDICAAEDIIIGLGHTSADYDTTCAAIDYASSRGATVTATHLFNAMPPLNHRAPGPVGALVNASRRGAVSVELIADGVHLHDATVDAVLSDNAFAVSDAMEAAGMPDGSYRLGHLDVTVSGGVARIATGSIAGGTSTLAEQFARFAGRHGGPQAVRFTSTNAARVLGRGTPGDRGDIVPGARADLVGLDERRRPVRVIRGGVELSI
ncbi:N-acetylglucosamine-6-phosphate deacetylase [Corynebacterium timonense]|uniref:N-acetylglucosamine-6-phosphate deacetylase n=1 Tax=Corynebacterium timonense TaxID=441500 RepID=A0A1H1NB86_9CORY|nr:amidohydrolase family protein [Corynebacterium timonense]SDR96110.1 N-acetylglucosamine-6-phosphate deacetylase [Corynebacterium timonense]